jgi:hypothetical protein
MKILWFTNTPANADGFINRQLKGTGGWLKALDQELQKHVSLHVAFHYINDQNFKYQGTDYHPIKIKKSFFKNVFRKFGFSFFSYTEYLKQYLEIIDDSKYFPSSVEYENARYILSKANEYSEYSTSDIKAEDIDDIIEMTLIQVLQN